MGDHRAGPEVSLHVGVAFVAQAHDGPWHDLVGRGQFHDLAVLEQVGEVHDAPGHLPLLLLGCVVVAVLGEVAQLSSGLDLAGDVDPPARHQILVFRRDAVIGGL